MVGAIKYPRGHPKGGEHYEAMPVPSPVFRSRPMILIWSQLPHKPETTGIYLSRASIFVRVFHASVRPGYTCPPPSSTTITNPPFPYSDPKARRRSSTRTTRRVDTLDYSRLFKIVVGSIYAHDFVPATTFSTAKATLDVEALLASHLFPIIHFRRLRSDHSSSFDESCFVSDPSSLGRRRWDSPDYCRAEFGLLRHAPAPSKPPILRRSSPTSRDRPCQGVYDGV